MRAVDIENRNLHSSKTVVLEVSNGWYLASQGWHWPTWVEDGDSFTTDEVNITANLAKALHFQFENRKDPEYRFARQVAWNFPKSRFVPVAITLGDTKAFPAKRK